MYFHCCSLSKQPVNNPNINKKKQENVNKKISPPFSYQGISAILDAIGLSCNRMVLSRCRPAGTYLHDSSRRICRKTRKMVVRQRLSAWQFLRSRLVRTLTPPPHSTVCPHIRFPSVHGVVYFYDVWSADVFCMGRLERHGACVLEHHPCDNRRGHSPLVRLCSPDMVFLLSYGHAIVVCIAKTIPVALRLYQYPRCRHMSDEVQELCQSLPDAAHAIRLPWYSNRLS